MDRNLNSAQSPVRDRPSQFKPKKSTKNNKKIIKKRFTNRNRDPPREKKFKISDPINEIYSNFSENK